MIVIGQLIRGEPHSAEIGERGRLARCVTRLAGHVFVAFSAGAPKSAGEAPALPRHRERTHVKTLIAELRRETLREGICRI